MSFAGRAASSSGYVGRPRGRETGLTGYADPIQRSLPTGSSAMETAEHREPYESRGSRTVLGAPGGESPPGDSTKASILACPQHVRLGGNLGNAGCPGLPVEGSGLDVVQAPKPEPRIMRYELTDFEWAAIRSFLPNKPRGIPRE